MLDTNRYGQSFVCYIDSQQKPTAGSYDVHVTFDGSETEGIIKNVPLKEESEMPTINGKGQQTVFLRSMQRSLYVRFKTGSQARYKFNLKLPFEYTYLPGYTDMSIYDEEDDESYSVNNGEIFTLEPNKIYIISAYLGGRYKEATTGTFTVTPIELQDTGIKTIKAETSEVLETLQIWGYRKRKR